MPSLLVSLVQRLVALTSIAVCLSLVPSGSAGAATVVNGDFEVGLGLPGWLQTTTRHKAGEAEHDDGRWGPYSAGFFGSFLDPPQGNRAAIDLQFGWQGRQILYQDIALEPNYAHELSLTAYYRNESVSETPISAPNTLDPQAVPNQQYRIDVIRPTAALDSLDPADILATVFATKSGDPEKMAPTRFGVDLTPFAGQTVRLRLVVVAGPYLYACVDAVSIASTPLPPLPPSNLISLGKPKFNMRNGTAKLPVTIPGAGALSLTGKGVVKQNKTATAAGMVKLLVKSKGKKKKALNQTGKAKVKVKITFTPTGGTANSASRKLVLTKRLH